MHRWLQAVGLGTAVAAATIGGAWAADEPKPSVMTEEQRLAKGKDLIDSVCFWCHEPELMETKALNKEQWAYLIAPMVKEGAPLTDDEFKMVVEYLAKNFGPENEQ